MQFSANHVAVPPGRVGIRGSRSFEWGGWPAAKKVAILTVLTGLSAMLTYLIQWASGMDFGLLAPVIMATLAAAAEALRQFIADFSGTVEVEVPKDT